MVGAMGAKKLLANVGTRVQLVIRRKTLTVIVQYSNSRGQGSGL